MNQSMKSMIRIRKKFIPDPRHCLLYSFYVRYGTSLHFVKPYSHNFLYFAFLRLYLNPERYDGRNRIPKEMTVGTGSGKILRSKPDPERYDGQNRMRKDKPVVTGSEKIQRSEPDPERYDGRNRKDTTIGTGKIRRSELERCDGRNRKDTTVGTGIHSGLPCARQARQAGQPGSPEEPPSF
jgi:hypothetical protein